MTIQRPVELYRGDLYFSELPIYVNRAVETHEASEHRHDFLEISCVAEGAGTHHIGNRSLPVTQGDIFWLPVGVSHVFRPASASKLRPLVVYNCIVEPGVLSRVLQLFPGGDACMPLLAHDRMQQYRDRHGEFHRLFQKLHYEYASAHAGREAALYLGMLELLLFLHRAEAEQTAAAAAPLPDGMEEVLHLLHTQFDRHLSLSEASALCGVGERQFHRLFKKQTGMTLTGYAQSVRMNEACRLLRTTSGRVSEIAAAAGYQDLTFFNQLFKKITGSTPRAYRRGTRDIKEDEEENEETNKE